MPKLSEALQKAHNQYKTSPLQNQLNWKHGIYKDTIAIIERYPVIKQNENLFNAEESIGDLRRQIEKFAYDIETVLIKQDVGDFKALQNSFSNYIDSFITLLEKFNGEDKDDEDIIYLTLEEIEVITKAYRHLEEFGHFILEYLDNSFHKETLKNLRENYEDARLSHAKFWFMRDDYVKAKSLLEKKFIYSSGDEEERERILGIINASTAKNVDIKINKTEVKAAKVEKVSQPSGSSRAKLNELIERRKNKKPERREIEKWESTPASLLDSKNEKPIQATTTTTTTATASSHSKRKSQEAAKLSSGKKQKKTVEQTSLSKEADDIQPRRINKRRVITEDDEAPTTTSSSDATLKKMEQISPQALNKTDAILEAKTYDNTSAAPAILTQQPQPLVKEFSVFSDLSEPNKSKSQQETKKITEEEFRALTYEAVKEYTLRNFSDFNDRYDLQDKLDAFLSSQEPVKAMHISVSSKEELAALDGYIKSEIIPDLDKSAEQFKVSNFTKKCILTGREIIYQFIDFHLPKIIAELIPLSKQESQPAINQDEQIEPQTITPSLINLPLSEKSHEQLQPMPVVSAPTEVKQATEFEQTNSQLSEKKEKTEKKAKKKSVIKNVHDEHNLFIKNLINNIKHARVDQKIDQIFLANTLQETLQVCTNQEQANKVLQTYFKIREQGWNFTLDLPKANVAGDIFKVTQKTHGNSKFAAPSYKLIFNLNFNKGEASKGGIIIDGKVVDTIFSSAGYHINIAGLREDLKLLLQDEDYNNYIEIVSSVSRKQESACPYGSANITMKSLPVFLSKTSNKIELMDVSNREIDFKNLNGDYAALIKQLDEPILNFLQNEFTKKEANKNLNHSEYFINAIKQELVAREQEKVAKEQQKFDTIKNYIMALRGLECDLHLAIIDSYHPFFYRFGEDPIKKVITDAAKKFPIEIIDELMDINDDKELTVCPLKGTVTDFILQVGDTIEKLSWTYLLEYYTYNSTNNVVLNSEQAAQRNQARSESGQNISPNRNPLKISELRVPVEAIKEQDDLAQTYLPLLDAMTTSDKLLEQALIFVQEIINVGNRYAAILGNKYAPIRQKLMEIQVNLHNENLDLQPNILRPTQSMVNPQSLPMRLPIYNPRVIGRPPMVGPNNTQVSNSTPNLVPDFIINPSNRRQ